MAQTSTTCKKPWKGSRHCSVIGCSNGDYSLAKWRNSICCVHEECQHVTSPCDCSPPFDLFSFPTALKNPDGRKKWIQILNRDGKKKVKNGNQVKVHVFVLAILLMVRLRKTILFPPRIWVMIPKGKLVISSTKVYFVPHLVLPKPKGKNLHPLLLTAVLIQLAMMRRLTCLLRMILIWYVLLQIIPIVDLAQSYPL